MKSKLPIGIFDSGVGGLTVYRGLRERLPREQFVYLGDTARVPYGTKSLSTVERYATENARFLESKGIKLLVVACNTASALALPAIREAVDVSVIGVIEPGARAAVRASQGHKIGVIGTEATIRSGAYRDTIATLQPSAEVTAVACPLFVSLAEEGWAESDVARTVAREYLDEFCGSGIDTLVLGCTHYPLLKKVISEVVGPSVSLVDSGQATAAEVELLLTDLGLVQPPGHSGHLPALAVERDHFFVTDAAERFSRVAERFLGASPSNLEAVEVWGHDELRAH